ncbi:NAD(P)H-dependent oxidoreductase [Flavobacterium aquicola]|uniref:Putative NADPH-quinone reductase n=1 Tax=Flavobacterium aquicola TaxID=1682742 RepID=A0A3E0EQQ3_9FLAO|nr:NAD(P)H-dependent oxidoreductase [Flavobacterium aquicola]REG99486.1 putative NADPH-quinone reductase [Flavobacterium aquicola]
METNKKILIIHTHQVYEGISEGKLNKTLALQAKTFFEKKGYEVLETMITDGYNPEQEIEKHVQADLVIIQTPVNWFNAPWMYKKYVDEVFMMCLMTQKIVSNDGRSTEDSSKQYGTGGLSQGKKVMISATWNANKEAFNDTTQYLFAGKSADDALFNITLNYKFSGYGLLPNFHCYDVWKNPQLDLYKTEYALHLEKTFQNM